MDDLCDHLFSQSLLKWLTDVKTLKFFSELRVIDNKYEANDKELTALTSEYRMQKDQKRKQEK